MRCVVVLALAVIQPIAAAAQSSDSAAAADTMQTPDSIAFGIQTKFDEFDKRRTTMIRVAHHGTNPRFRIDPKCSDGGDVATLEFLKSQTPGTPTSYAAFTEYEGSAHWLYIGETPLQFLVDGVLVEMPPIVKKREVIDANFLSETATFLATPAKLRQIARGSAIKVRIQGAQGGNCVFTLPPESLAAVRKFVAKEVQ